MGRVVQFGGDSESLDIAKRHSFVVWADADEVEEDAIVFRIRGDGEGRSRAVRSTIELRQSGEVRAWLDGYERGLSDGRRGR